MTPADSRWCPLASEYDASPRLCQSAAGGRIPIDGASWAGGAKRLAESLTPDRMLDHCDSGSGRP